jgi:hypothetical protein
MLIGFGSSNRAANRAIKICLITLVDEFSNKKKYQTNICLCLY